MIPASPLEEVAEQITIWKQQVTSLQSAIMKRRHDGSQAALEHYERVLADISAAIHEAEHERLFLSIGESSQRRAMFRPSTPPHDNPIESTLKRNLVDNVKESLCYPEERADEQMETTRPRSARCRLSSLLTPRERFLSSPVDSEHKPHTFNHRGQSKHSPRDQADEQTVRTKSAPLPVILPVAVKMLNIEHGRELLHSPREQDDEHTVWPATPTLLPKHVLSDYDRHCMHSPREQGDEQVVWAEPDQVRHEPSTPTLTPKHSLPHQGRGWPHSPTGEGGELMHSPREQDDEHIVWPVTPTLLPRHVLSDHGRLCVLSPREQGDDQSILAQPDRVQHGPSSPALSPAMHQGQGDEQRLSILSKISQHRPMSPSHSLASSSTRATSFFGCPSDTNDDTSSTF
jgi:hypothetical protein